MSYNVTQFDSIVCEEIESELMRFMETFIKKIKHHWWFTCGVLTLNPSARKPNTPLVKVTVAALRSTLFPPAG